MYLGKVPNIPNLVVIKDVLIVNNNSVAEWQKELTLMAYVMFLGFLAYLLQPIYLSVYVPSFWFLFTGVPTKHRHGIRFSRRPFQYLE